MLEAQKFGLPVIANNIAVLNEVAGDGAHYFDKENTPAFAQAMKALTTDDVYFEELSQKALNNAAKFDWKKSAEQTEEVFKSILSGAQGKK